VNQPSGIPGWTRLGVVDPGDLVDDRLQLHHAVQLLSAFGQTYLEARSDDSHRSLSWNPRERSFATDATATGLRLEMDVPEFRAVLSKSGRQLSAMTLTGANLSDARKWLQETAGAASDDGAPALGWREYELPAHPVEGNAPFSPAVEGLLELSNWYSDAWRLLDTLRKTKAGSSAIRCWPHHFDLATLITVVPAADGQDARTVGVGLSPGDTSSSAPYFYVNLWPYPDAEALPEIDGPGRWNREGWIGAVLPAEAVIREKDPDAQAEMAGRFIDQRVKAARRLLLAN
jgi:hypothetical protein